MSYPSDIVLQVGSQGEKNPHQATGLAHFQPMFEEMGEVIAVIGGETGLGDDGGSGNHRVHAQRSLPASSVEKPGCLTCLGFVLAGGCFWCTEAVFAELNGVLDVVSGYAGGDPATARYDTVVSGRTAHAECVRVLYDPTRISEEEILHVFFTIAHDPTQLNRQGADVGGQYRSAVFYDSEAQKRLVEGVIAALQAEGEFAEPIVTTLEPLQGFFEAEGYHQNYARSNPEQPYVRRIIEPKIENLRNTYPERLKQN